MEIKKKKKLFWTIFPLWTQSPPFKKCKFYFYCRLAVSECLGSLTLRSWQVLLRGPSGDRIARCCRHTGPDLTVKTEGER